MEFSEVKKKTMNILARRNHSAKELADKLARYGAEAEQIDEAIEWAKEYGFINDKAYAKALASDMLNIKKYAKKRIEAELLRKGIDRWVTEDVLSEFEVDESEVLKPLVEKRLAGDYSRKNAERVMRYFVARGYSFSDVGAVIRSLEENDFGI